ncbi:CamS family sex pheromone protein [Aerococcaceae bacterium INB8]|uniref:CamS family sex pheromone protein n=1 Tax=Ruoffia halotolerans TaxID=2748684 RepID=A0A839A288_9LACT|nr:CamS family sex pheromone protein [Ruoffia halotolerans]MBA5728306.1 CamS family sex pheromone protein [Ruoffia halotolerans]
MNKKIRMNVSILLACLMLVGGVTQVRSQAQEDEPTNPDEVTVQTTTNQLASEFYRAVIIDGQYQIGASASSNKNLSSAANIRAFEEGLLRISKQVFPTEQYFMQEGQIIDEVTMTSWLARESATNPEGLNPALPEEVAETQSSLEESLASEESVDPADDPEDVTEEGAEENEQIVTNVQSTPIYLSQVSEKNLMVETEDGFALGGIVLGLAMNSTYEYTDADGVIHKQEISVGEMRERGRQFANIIVGRLRNTEELRSVPIVVGIYRTAPNDEVVGGTYVLDGISREGNSVTDWTENNEYRIALPIIEASNQSDQYVYFDNFNNEIINFFPNLNGISGEALYIDGGLASLNVEIVSQFYKQTEITALTQHITDVSQRTLPEGVAIEIKVISDAGVEAYVGRPAGATQYQSHIFNK